MPAQATSVLTVILGLCLAAPARATYFEISTANNATLGGLTFRDGDVVLYDSTADSSTLIFNEDLFLSNENVDALHVLASGSLVLSTTTAASLGGLSFQDGDLVVYDPNTGTASLLFDEALFSNSADIDGVHVLPGGELLLSTTSTETLGGLTFRDGDIARYDPVADTATLFFSEDEFGSNANIDGLSLLPNGNLVLTTQTSTTLGGVAIDSGDLVEWAPLTRVATIIFFEGTFNGGSGNIDAVSAPEPGTGALLGAGLLVLGIRARRRGR